MRKAPSFLSYARKAKNFCLRAGAGNCIVKSEKTGQELKSMSDVSKNIRRFRNQKQMTQEELAAALHVTRQTVSNWEMSRSYPDLDMVVKLAEALGTDPNALLYPPRPTSARRRYRPVAYTAIFITLLVFFLMMTLFGGVFVAILQPLIGGGVEQSYLYPLYGGMMMLAALMVGCTCVILDELRNPSEEKGERESPKHPEE